MSSTTASSSSSAATYQSQPQTPEQLAISRMPVRYEIPGWADCKYSNRASAFLPPAIMTSPPPRLKSKNIQACILHALPFLAPGANELAASTGKCFHCWALLTSMEYAVLSVIFVLNSIGFAVSFVRYLINMFFSFK
ncbi:uncharacterized protein H6S33_011083 [Morchella sextelata]|uniref:uncharacterized protein n=1 Tax=Morchella sextelata TaxID=1174677 RepID=UPI001D03CD57|nr:uncharacterized protein H6S33_011083 [Morchella sextelata]KAH0611818.1 hypothetical protein H6S33_011083 [Morchella sextelata]